MNQYKVERYYNYIHSTTSNFNQISRQKIVQSTFKKIRKEVKKIVIQELINAKAFWENLRTIFINYLLEQLKDVPGFDKKTISKPDVFLEALNRRFTEERKEDLVGYLVDYKKMSVKFKKPDAKKRKEKFLDRTEKEIQKDIDLMMKLFVKLKELEEYYSQDWPNKTPTELAKIKEEKDRLEGYLNKVYTGVGPNNLKQLLGQGKKPSPEKIVSILNRMLGNQIPQNLGKILDVAFTNPASGAGKYLVDLFPKSLLVGEEGRNLTTITDAGMIEIDVKGEKVIFGTSIKLRQDSYAGSNYVPKTLEEILEEKGAGSSKDLDIINWYKYNIISLQNWASEDKKMDIFQKTKRGEKRKDLSRELKLLYYLEKDVAQFSLILRALDGLYEDAKNINKGGIKNLPILNGYRYHTPLVFVQGKFVWTVDILDATIKDLKNRDRIKGARVLVGGLASYNQLQDASLKRDLEDLYSDKMSIRREYFKNNPKLKYITYEMLLSNGQVAQKQLSIINNYLKKVKLIKSVPVHFNIAQVWKKNRRS